MGDAFIINRGNADRAGRLPIFKYTGEYSLYDAGFDGEERNWHISFGNSGEFTPSKDMEVEVFRASSTGNSDPYKITLSARTSYPVVSGDVEMCYFNGKAYNWPRGRGTVVLRNVR